MVDLGQSDLDVAGDLVGREGGLSHSLAEQIERICQVSLRHVDVDNEARLAGAGAERNSLALQQLGKLLSGMPGRSLIEGSRHDRGDAFALSRLALERHRDSEADRDHVLAGDAVGDHVQSVGELGPLRLGERPRLRCDHVRPLDHAVLGKGAILLGHALLMGHEASPSCLR